MPFASTVLAEADAPARSRAAGHTRVQASGIDALHALLLALLASLLGQPAASRILWQFPAYSPVEAGDEGIDLVPQDGESKSARRLRAWIGWILRCLPGLGMVPSGLCAAPAIPARSARAPPLSWASHAPRIR